MCGCVERKRERERERERDRDLERVVCAGGINMHMGSNYPARKWGGELGTFTLWNTGWRTRSVRSGHTGVKLGSFVLWNTGWNTGLLRSEFALSQRGVVFPAVRVASPPPVFQAVFPGSTGVVCHPLTGQTAGKRGGKRPITTPFAPGNLRVGMQCVLYHPTRCLPT